MVHLAVHFACMRAVIALLPEKSAINIISMGMKAGKIPNGCVELFTSTTMGLSGMSAFFALVPPTAEGKRFLRRVSTIPRNVRTVLSGPWPLARSPH